MRKQWVVLITIVGVVTLYLVPTTPAWAGKPAFSWPSMLPAIVSSRAMRCVRGSNDFTVCSGSFVNGEQLPDKYTLYGSNISPQLSWSNPPAGTAAYGILVYDIDASYQGYYWVHWMCKVPATTTSLSENAGLAGGANLPAGSSRYPNSFAEAGVAAAAGTDYDGPMPPAGSGVHHYYFSVAPLDSSGRYLGSPVALVGLYSRD